MSKVNRYTEDWNGLECGCNHVIEDEHGRYVEHTEYAALEAENAEQARLLGMGGSREAALLAKVAGLEAENARMREALGDMRFAYINKDGEFPHDFETKALAMAENILGALAAPAPSNSPGIPDSSPAPVEDEKKACIICGGTKKDLRFAEQGSTADDCPPCPNPDCNAGEGERP